MVPYIAQLIFWVYLQLPAKYVALLSGSFLVGIGVGGALLKEQGYQIAELAALQPTDDAPCESYGTHTCLRYSMFVAAKQVPPSTLLITNTSNHSSDLRSICYSATKSVVLRNRLREHSFGGRTRIYQKFINNGAQMAQT